MPANHHDSHHALLLSGLIGWGDPTTYWERNLLSDLHSFLSSAAAAASVSASDFSSSASLSALWQVHICQPGALSSYHDQACEVFAQVKGRRVDFGAEHSQLFHHHQFGRDFRQSGLLPNWSEEQPLYIICHSSAANVVRCLAHYLSQDYWQVGSNARWIRAVVFLNPNFNGSTLTTRFGLDKDPREFKKTKYLSLVDKLLFSFDWLSKRMQSKGEFDCNNLCQWHLEHWLQQNGNASAEQCHSPPRHSWKFQRQQLEEMEFLSNKDNLFYDLSLQGSAEFNQRLRQKDTSSQEFYKFILFGKITNKQKSISIRPSINPVLIVPAGYMLWLKSSQFSTALESSPLWFENDGVLPVASQQYPTHWHDSAAPLPDSVLSCVKAAVASAESTEQALHFTKNNAALLDKSIWYWINLKVFVSTKHSWDHLDCVFGRNFLKPGAFQHSHETQLKLFKQIFRLFQLFSE